MASTSTLALALTLLLLLALSATDAVTFTITNCCSSTLWPSAVPGGGCQLDPGQTWTLDVPNGTYNGLIWARTACTFDATGHGTCQTGDCGGLLNCTAVGSSPLTLAVYSVNQFKNLDWYDISLVGGFNVPMDLASTSGGCHDIKCAADITGQCPEELRAPGGCNNPCTVFKTEEYCCTTGSSCGPTEYSRFFKNLCPEAYSYPRDDQTSLFTCPGGGDYRVAFCP